MIVISVLGLGGVVLGAYGMILSDICDWQLDQPKVDNPDYQDDQERIMAITCGLAGILAPNS